MAIRVFQTSEQTRQIKAMMAARKRALSTHTVNYPKWVPGMTTREYVNRFNISNRFGLVNPDHVPARQAPFNTSDMVLVEEVADFEPHDTTAELLAA